MRASGITGAITMNGQYILLDGEVIYKEAIPKAIITKLLHEADQVKEALSFYDSDHYWVSQLTEFARKAYGHFSQTMPKADRDYYLDHEVNMLLVLTDKLSQVAYYKTRVPELNFFMNSPSSIDVTNVSTDKGTGVAHIKEILGFTGETYAFGDGRNDLALLKACDHKTAMGNAVPELKEIADFVSSSNTDHGIVKAFQHWGLM
jgi:Cof subfamily protein (haloacid dehalogenase superfamily)